MRTATREDFKVGNTLHDKHGSYTITKKYDDEVWEARGERGEKCLFEIEADCYQVEG